MNSLCTTHWESKKLSTWSWCGTFAISVSLLLCCRVIGKKPGLISHNNFVKKNVLANVTWSYLCSGVTGCGTKCPHNFLVPKSSFRIGRTAVLGMFKDSTIILDAIWWSLFTKSATAAMLTSVWVDFGYPSLSISSRLPSIKKTRIPPKNIWSVQSFIPISPLHQH